MTVKTGLSERRLSIARPTGQLAEWERMAQHLYSQSNSNSAKSQSAVRALVQMKIPKDLNVKSIQTKCPQQLLPGTQPTDRL